MVWIFVASGFFAGNPAPSLAGNKWMMEKNARELIIISETIIRELPELKEGTHVFLDARITNRDGQIVLVIEQMDLKDVKSLIPGQSSGYRSFIRFLPMGNSGQRTGGNQEKKEK